jgi:hypothetical protein
MRIELRDEDRLRVGWIDVDPALRPTRVTIVRSDREVFLDWDTAVDDAGRLRRCVACGCTDLFAEKVFPLVTGVIVVLAFAGFVLGALSFFGMLRFAGSPYVLWAMGVILAADVAILLFSRRRLVCYRCRSAFYGLPIARYHRSWDRSIAERYPAPRRPERPPWAKEAEPKAGATPAPAPQAETRGDASPAGAATPTRGSAGR